MSTLLPSTSRSGFKRVSAAARWVCEPLDRRILLCAVHSGESFNPLLTPAPEVNYAALMARPITDASTDGGAADIVWVNRVTSDNFGVYGANTALARSIVDRAIADWERVINDFNYAGGANAFNLTVLAQSGPPGSAQITDVDAQGKPRSGTARLDDFGGAGQPWYFDSVPGTSAVPDDSEFDDFVTRFNNDGGPGPGLDFYLVALHEIGHLLGVGSETSDNGDELAVKAFIDYDGWVIDPNNPGDGCDPNDPNCADPGNHVFPVNFNGGAVDYSMTNAGSGDHPNTYPAHLYEGPPVGGFPTHPNELLNDGRTLDGNLNQRLLIGNVTASFLRDIYGYTVTLPAQLNTFYANLDTVTNVLRIEGEPGTAVDNITLTTVGTDLRVQVNGTSELIPIVDIDEIEIRSNSGADVINLFGVPAGISVDVASFNGAKLINVGNGDIDNEVQGPVTISGVFDPYTLRVFDQNDTGNDSYTVTSTSITKPGTLFGGVTFDAEAQTIVLSANEFNNVINIASLSAGASLTINGRGGDDQVIVGGTGAVIGETVLGNLTINAGTLGNDLVMFDDTAGAGADVYLLNGGNYQQTGTQVLTFNDAERVELRANNQDSAIGVANTFGYTLEVLGRGGGDFIDMGFGFVAGLGAATVWGGDGADTLRINDTSALAATTFVVNQTGGLPFVELFNGANMILFDSMANLTIDGGPFADTITTIAVPSETSPRINGNGGADSIFVQGHPTLNSALFPRVTVTGGAANDTVEVNTDGTGGARAEFIQSEVLDRLAFGDGGRLRLGAGKRVIDVLTSVVMPASGFELDLTDGYFVRRGNPSLDFYNSRVAVGYNAGAWTGLGINSSTAAGTAIGDGVGLGRASEIFGGVGGTIDGIVLGATEVILRYALYGDANLDGTVNLVDYNRLASNYNQLNTNWVRGNFNFDNTTNLVDYNLLSANYGQTI